MRPETVNSRDWRYHGGDLVRDARRALWSEAERILKANQDAEPHLFELRTRIDAARNAPTHAGLLANLTACQVALELMRANGAC